MTPPKSRKSLGRGLDALFGDAAEESGGSVDGTSRTPGKGLLQLPIGQLFPSPLQPRRKFDDSQLEELATSIRDKGVLQPLLVRMVGTGYEIIAGERRWRAAQRAQVHQVPALIKDLDDTEVLEVALVENLQRADLTPLEEAEGYQRLLDEFGHTQEILADLLGKSRTHITNMIRLLALPDPIKAMLDDGQLSIGHARALLGVKDAVALARKIVAKGMSVRQVEALVKQHGKASRPRKKASTKAQAKDADTRALEARLEEALGLKVGITFDGAGGTLSLTYTDLEQLDDLIARLTMQKTSSSQFLNRDAKSRDSNVLDIEEVLAKREGRVQLLRENHSGDRPDPTAHPDPEADDVGSDGALERLPKPQAESSGSEDHGIDEAMCAADAETGHWQEGHSEDPAKPTAQPDPKAGDVGASGSTDKK